jgi:proteasome lid subunit RPN8/RPN11
VVGAYHSHPVGAPEPSATDLEMAFGDFIFMIVSEPTRGGEVHAFVLRDNQLAEMTLTVI